MIGQKREYTIFGFGAEVTGKYDVAISEGGDPGNAYESLAATLNRLSACWQRYPTLRFTVLNLELV